MGVTWGSIRWGTSRWWERVVTAISYTGACLTLSDSAVTVCTLTDNAINCAANMANYTLGNVIKLAANFKSGGADVDPTTVTFKVKTPVGLITSYTYGTDPEIVKDSTGDYYVHFTPTIEGRHVYRFASATTYIAAEESTFDVVESQFN